MPNLVVYLFALKRNDDEAAPFSHLMLGSSLSSIISKLNSDIKILSDDSDIDSNELDTIIDYLADCSIWSLGSIDFLSGDLVSVKEKFDNVVDVCEVIADVYKR